MLFNPVRQLYRSYIAALAMMGTPFADKYFIAVLKTVELSRALYGLGKIALLPGE